MIGFTYLNDILIEVVEYFKPIQSNFSTQFHDEYALMINTMD